MKNILVTGITGGIGRAFIPYLKNMGSGATCIVRQPAETYGIDTSGLDFIEADIVDRKKLFQFASRLEGKIDTIVHMASARDGQTEVVLKDVILNGSMNLMSCRKR
jgi:nucleoside-diphosphate-sugar epimerase